MENRHPKQTPSLPALTAEEGAEGPLLMAKGNTWVGAPTSPGYLCKAVSDVILFLKHEISGPIKIAETNTKEKEEGLLCR